MKKVICNFIKYLILTLFTMTSGFILYYFNKLNILELKYFIILCVIVGLLWLLILIKLMRTKTKLFSKIVFGLIAMILSLGYFIGIKYIDGTISFINNMTKVQYETQKYSLMVLNNSPFSNINHLKDNNIGFLSSNTHLNKTKETLEEKGKISFNSKDYDEIGYMISGLYNNELSAIVLDESYIELLTENNVDFLNESRVIYTFELKIKKEDNKTSVDVKKESFIIYISGSDSRDSVSERARSDVNIVAVVNPNTNKILLVSIPRDYYVQLHGTVGTKDKLTHAGIYGIDMSKKTIQDLLDIDINYYAKVSFSTLINAVDVIDGLEIYSDKSFTSYTNNDCKFVLGTNQVDGECALAFARERYAYTEGDRHRGENQQAVITAIINKLSNPTYLTKYDDILKAIDGSFETDMSYEEITNLVKYQLNELTKWQIESISLDGTGALFPTYSMGSQNLYVMIPDEQTIQIAKEKILQYMDN